MHRLRSGSLQRTFVALWMFLVSATCFGAEEPTPLARVVPGGAFAYLEATGLDRVVDQLTHPKLLEYVHGTPQWKEYQASPAYQKAMAGKLLVETQIGMDVVTAMKDLFGRQWGVALYPVQGRPQPDVVGVVRARSAKVVDGLRQRLDAALTLFAGDGVDRSEKVNGVAIVALQNKAFFAIHDEWIAASSNKDLLKRSLTNIVGKPSGTLAETAGFASVMRDFAPSAQLRGYVDTAVIRQAAGAKLPKKLDNALVSLLVGGVYELGMQSPGLGAALKIDDRRVGLSVRVPADARKLPEAYQGFFATQSKTGATPPLMSPNTLMAFSLYRDFTGLYKQREALLQEHVLPGFDKFEAGLANLMPGRNFAEDILPVLGRNVTFVISKQDFRHLSGPPAIQLPGFAMVIEPANPQAATELFQLVFQTIISILNFQVGEKGGEPMVMSSLQQGDVTISYGKHMRNGGGEAPFMFNFTPSSARVGNHLILSSSLGVCRELVETLKNGAVDGGSVASESARPNARLIFQAAPIADMLEINRKLIESRTIQSGKTAERAAFEFQVLVGLVRRLEAFRVESVVGPDSYELQLGVDWK